MHRLRWTLLCAVLLLLVRSAAAGEMDDLVNAVLDAAKKKDPAALREVAAGPRCEAWQLTAELCVRGEFDAARDFAAVLKGKDFEKLPAYVESRRGKTHDPRIGKALREASRLRGLKDHEGVLRVLDETLVDESDASWATFVLFRAMSLDEVRPDDAPAAWLATGKLCAKLGWTARAAPVLRKAGLTAFARGQPRVGVEAWGALVEVEEFRGDRALVADAIGNLGLCHDTLGDTKKALELLERALAMKVELGQRSSAAGTLINLGNIALRNGDLAGAEERYRRAREEAEAAEDWNFVAGAMASTARVQDRRGELAEAMRTYEEAIATYEKAGSPPDLGTSLMNLGALHLGLGDLERAETLLVRAKSVFEAAGQTASLLGVLVNLGGLRSRRGDPAGGVEYCRAALEIARRTEDPLEIGAVLGALGETEARAGRLAEGRAALEEELALRRNLKDRAGEATALGRLGQILSAAEDHEASLDHFRRALAISAETGPADTHLLHLAGAATELQYLDRNAEAVAAYRKAIERLNALSGALSDEHGATLRESWAALYRLGLNAAARIQSPADACWFIECGRAGALLEALKVFPGLSTASLPAPLFTADRDARARLAQARRALDEATAGRRLAPIQAARAELSAAERAAADVVGRIQREAKLAADLVYPQPAPLDEIRSWLAPAEAMVLFGEVSMERVAVVVTAKDARIVKLGPTAPVDEASAALSPSDPATPADDALAAFTSLVVDKLGLAADAKRVYVCPDGPLSYVPFSAALPGRDVVYVPSATTWGRLRGGRPTPAKKVLALGDPVYDGATAGGDRAAGTKLAPLPGTREEAKSVGDVLLLGADATETGLRKRLAGETRWRAVHLACHGLFDPGRPADSALALTPEEDGDGRLSVLEVFGLRVPADLVTLSACETARGQVRRGEGIMGFTRAFMLAGSPRVMVSLWKVDDRATLALMKKFYEEWRPGTGRTGAAGALRAAQEHVRSKPEWKHPAYWAAWQLWGLGD